VARKTPFRQADPQDRGRASLLVRWPFSGRIAIVYDEVTATARTSYTCSFSWQLSAYSDKNYLDNFPLLYPGSIFCQEIAILRERGGMGGNFSPPASNCLDGGEIIISPGI
jgi:hypothetical protein